MTVPKSTFIVIVYTHSHGSDEASLALSLQDEAVCDSWFLIPRTGIYILGPPGHGKTALVHVLVFLPALSKGGLVSQGECTEQTRTILLISAITRRIRKRRSFNALLQIPSSRMSHVPIMSTEGRSSVCSSPHSIPYTPSNKLSLFRCQAPSRFIQG